MSALEIILGDLLFRKHDPRKWPIVVSDYVKNPEYETAKYEETYTGWCDGSVQFRRRFKDPQGKIEVPRFIPKLT
jgi:hypothetical protein